MSNWIKVTDELPEENKDVLIYDPEVGVCIAWRDEDDFCALGLNFVEATYWMPIPEIPEESEEPEES